MLFKKKKKDDMLRCVWTIGGYINFTIKKKKSFASH
jgi:hypothetical protein